MDGLVAQVHICRSVCCCCDVSAVGWKWNLIVSGFIKINSLVSKLLGIKNCSILLHWPVAYTVIRRCGSIVDKN